MSEPSDKAGNRYRLAGLLCVFLCCGACSWHFFQWLGLNEPLFLATASRDHVEMERLLRWGADPDDRFDGSELPLMAAIRNDDAIAVELLLRFGADKSETEQGKPLYSFAKSEKVRALLKP